MGGVCGQERGVDGTEVCTGSRCERGAVDKVCVDGEVVGRGGCCTPPPPVTATAAQTTGMNSCFL